MNIIPSFPTARERYFAPLHTATATVLHRRHCQNFSDLEFLESGVGRCLALVESGRDWVQRLHGLLCHIVTVNCFFKSLRSDRRLRLLAAVCQVIVERCDREAGNDPFAEHRELDSFAVFAADGHYHAAAVHDPVIGQKRRPVGHFFALNLRTRSLRHLDIARPDHAAGKKVEHDISALKRLGGEVLRMSQPTGTKVLMVYDRAVIDFEQWHKWKKGRGIYIVTMEKSNMALIRCGNLTYDRDDPRNRGVIADEQLGHSKGRLIRRITYIDPVSGKTYCFLTNEFTLPPGLVAYLYKRRWDVEKIFDELKNKLAEGKAWASTATAKCQHGNFLCLTHNLTLLFERHLAENEGITDTNLADNRQAQLDRQSKRAETAGRLVNPLPMAAKKPTQRSRQFIRWLRDQMRAPTPWGHALDVLRPLMRGYLR